MQTDSKVIVTANAAGQVIIPSKNNPEWGYIRLEQTRMLVDEQNFVRKRTVSALLKGEISDLQQFGWKNGQEIGGRIIIKEQLTPFDKKNPERDLKVAGKTNVICRSGSDPIYRKGFWVQNESEADVIIEHTNTDEIKAAYAAEKAKKEAEGESSESKSDLHRL